MKFPKVKNLDKIIQRVALKNNAKARARNRKAFEKLERQIAMHIGDVSMNARGWL